MCVTTISAYRTMTINCTMRANLRNFAQKRVQIFSFQDHDEGQKNKLETASKNGKLCRFRYIYARYSIPHLFVAICLPRSMSVCWIRPHFQSPGGEFT